MVQLDLMINNQRSARNVHPPHFLFESSVPLRILISAAQPSARDRVTAQSSATSYSSSRSQSEA
jgi:hypothetical protein